MVSFLHGFILSMKGQTINKPKRNGDTSIKLPLFTKLFHQVLVNELYPLFIAKHLSY